jgi:hypothetical protein
MTATDNHGSEQRWESFADRFREGMKQAPGWVESRCGFSRTIQLPEGSFSLARVGPNVMGPRTDEYECNLMRLLEELGVADEFETFRIVCLTYGASAERLGALLKPKQESCAPVEITLRLSVLVPTREKKPRRMVMKPEAIATLRIRPHESTGSMYVNAHRIGEPERFAGQLDIRICQSILDEAEEE